MKLRLIFMILISFFLVQIGYADSTIQDVIKNTEFPSNIKTTIHDEKYGDISDRYCVYFNSQITGSATAKINLDKVFGAYLKTKEFDAILMAEGHRFEGVRDSMVEEYAQAQKNSQKDLMEKIKVKVIKYDKEKRAELNKRRDDKVLEVLSDIQTAVATYANKNQLKSVYVSRIPKIEGTRINISYQVLLKLKERKDISGEIISILNSEYKSQSGVTIIN